MPDTRPNLFDLVLKTIARVRARGPHEVAALMVERVRDEISSSSRLLVFARDARPTALERNELEVRRAGPDDAPAYARDIGTDAPGTFRRRLTAETWCYVVLGEHGSILHATWCTTAAAWTRELRGYLVPPQGDAYVYESFTRADARGRGVYPFALRSITSDLAAAGIRKVWVAAEQRNEASRRAITKAGFEIRFEIPFGRRWTVVRVLHPAVGSDALGLVRGRAF